MTPPEEDRTSLDDLLSGAGGPAEEPARPRSPARRRVVWLLKATLAAGALAGVLVLALRLVGYDLWYPLPVAGFLALFWLHRTVTGLGVRAAPGRTVRGPEPADPEGGPDHLVHAVQGWQTRLSWGRAGTRPFTRTAPLLAGLVDERLRLRLRHGVTMTGDQGRARALLGERLWAFLSDPAAPTPPPRELAALLTEVEKL